MPVLLIAIVSTLFISQGTAQGDGRKVIDVGDCQFNIDIDIPCDAEDPPSGEPLALRWQKDEVDVGEFSGEWTPESGWENTQMYNISSDLVILGVTNQAYDGDYTCTKIISGGSPTTAFIEVDVVCSDDLPCKDRPVCLYSAIFGTIGVVLLILIIALVVWKMKTSK